MNKKVIASLRNVFDGIMIFMLFVGTTVYALPSNGVTYDNSSSGSSATNVRDAIDDLYSKLSIKDNEINRLKGIGNASSNNILSGYTALVQGSTVTGSIPSKGATTYTPGTQNQTIASNQYLSGNQTIKGDANLVSGNIAKGKSIFGVSGTYTSDANAASGNILSGKTAYVNGSKITGTMANNAGKQVSVTNTSSDTSYTYLNIPSSGYYDTNSKLKVESSKLDNVTKKKLVIANVHSSSMNTTGGQVTITVPSDCTHGILIADLYGYNSGIGSSIQITDSSGIKSAKQLLDCSGGNVYAQTSYTSIWDSTFNPGKNITILFKNPNYGLSNNKIMIAY